MKTSQPAVLVAAEPTLYRAGLVALIQQQWPALPLTLTADAGQLADLVQAKQFRLLILDGSLLGRSLPALLKHLYCTRPAQRILLLAADHQPQPLSLLRVSVPRHIAPSYLATILSPWLDEALCQRIPSRALCPIPTQFSPRELEVLRLVVDDNCNQEIANHLYLSVRTVESHRRSLLQKSGARTLAGLVAWALREGMVA